MNTKPKPLPHPRTHSQPEGSQLVEQSYRYCASLAVDSVPLPRLLSLHLQQQRRLPHVQLGGWAVGRLGVELK